MKFFTYTRNQVFIHFRNILVSTFALTAMSYSATAQCGLSLTLSGSSSPCLGHDTLRLSGASATSQIIWQNNSATVATIHSVTDTSGGVTVAGDSYGNAGLTDSLLNAPIFIWVDGADNLYVSDKANNRVMRFAAGDREGVTVAGDPTGNAGGTDSLLNGPAGIFVDASGNLYIVDENNNRVMKWAPGAIYGTTVAGDSMGSSGTSDNLLSQPIGIWVDGSGNIYVSDQNNNRVMKWAPGAAAGVTVAGDSMGSSGISSNLLNTPAGITMDGSGNLYIADASNNRVQKWAPGASHGTTVAGDSTGNYGYPQKLLYFPFGVNFDATGHLYIADASNNRVQVWVPGDTSGHTFAGDSLGAFGVTPYTFNFPSSVFAAGSVIYVCDLGNNRVQRFGSSSIDTIYIPATAGSYTAIVTANGGCIDTSAAVIVDSLVTPMVAISATSTSLCGTRIDTFTASVSNGGASPIYVWYKNGVFSSSSTVYVDTALNNNDSISLEIIGNAPCTAATGMSNVLHITVGNPVAPAVTVIATSMSLPCTGTLTDTFTANISSGGTAPVYQWYIDGSAVSTADTLISSSLNAGDSVWLVITSNASCITTPSATSNVIHISGIVPVTPSAAISASTTVLPCNIGATDTFTASIANGGSSPGYAWYQDGVMAGTSATFITTVATHDSISLVLTSNAACTTTNTATSNTIYITGTAATDTPAISISANPAGPFCSGTHVAFTPVVTYGGSSPAYQWYLDGNPVSTSASYSNSGLQNNDSVWVVLTSNATCIASPTATSNVIKVTVNPTVTPTVTITASTGDSICQNQVVDLYATPTNGGATPDFQWKRNGANVGNSATYIANPIQNGDVFTCVLTSTATCVSPDTATSNAITFTVIPYPIASVSESSGSPVICPGDSIGLLASGGVSYAWSNGDSTQNIYVTTTGSYTVTVTNSYGCTAASSAVAVTLLSPVTETITEYGDSFVSAPPAEFYQWYIDGTPIGNALGQSYIATQSGQYQVSVIDTNGCKYSSQVVSYTAAGIVDVSTGASVRMYPNPNPGAFTVEFSDQVQRSVAVTDALGRIVMADVTVVAHATFNLGTLTDGLYYLQISDGRSIQALPFSVLK